MLRKPSLAFIIFLLAAPGLGAADFYNVRTYGAAGDGKALDSPAIDKAIAAAAEAGGGTVLVPAGKYLCGTIHLKSRIHLLIDAGAVILGAPQEMHAYDSAKPFDGVIYQDGGHSYFPNSLIFGENLDGVSISGQGMIDGGGLVSDSSPLDRLKGRDEKTKPIATDADRDALRLGNKAICLLNCRNLSLRDFTIYHGGHFGLLATGCDNLTVDGLTIDTNRDGMDFDCCRNTIISNCRVNSPNDDGICPKSSYALGRAVITENMTITNCQVSGFKEGTLLDGTMQEQIGGMGRIKFGTESSGGFRNITISNCTFRNCRGLALEEVDGGVMENVTISNIAMTNVYDYPIYITTGNRNRGWDKKEPSRMRNILISNVTAAGVSRKSGIQITGLPEQPLEGIRLRNIRIGYQGGGTRQQAEIAAPELGKGYPEPGKLGVMPAYGIFARHVRGLELADVTFITDQEDFRPAVRCEDVGGLEIDNLKAARAEGVPAGVFENVASPVVRNSPGFE